MASDGNSWATLASTLQQSLANSFQDNQIRPARPTSTIAAPAWRRPRSATTSRSSSARRRSKSSRGTWPRGCCSRKIYDHGLGNLEAAVAGYRKVIALAGYDGDESLLRWRPARRWTCSSEGRARASRLSRSSQSGSGSPDSTRHRSRSGLGIRGYPHGYCGGLPHTTGR